MIFSTPRGGRFSRVPPFAKTSVSDDVVSLPWCVADLLSLPDAPVSPEPQLPRSEFHHLRVVDEQVHVLPKGFQVPLENRGIRRLEHPCLVAEPVHELLHHILPPLR